MAKGRRDEENQLPLPLPSDGLVLLVRGGERVAAPTGIVYSCAPEVWYDEEDVPFVTKGPRVSVVAAEYVAHVLARHIGVAVPDFRLARFPHERHVRFASQLVEVVVRDVSFLMKQRLPQHREQLSSIVLLDVWLANRDRHISNLLARPAGGDGGAMEIVAIDFEKSVSLSDPHPIISCDALNQAELWPRGELRAHVNGLQKPGSLLRRISEVPDSVIAGALDKARELIGQEFTWFEDSGVALRRRRDRLPALVEEVWR